ncbi:MAG: hypothetical protein L0Y71_09460 [Gemmataceae bacterium]|nr:hypothetical protein [Gemmataceae bacterium]
MIRMKDILEMASRQPFQPFRIHCSDGSGHEVRHPELIKVSPTIVILFTPLEKHNYTAFDESQTISILHITRLEPLSATSKARKG